MTDTNSVEEKKPDTKEYVICDAVSLTGGQ